MEEQLLNAICSVFNVDKSSINLEILLSEIENYDSFKLVELLITLEKDLKINFSSQEIDGIHKVSDINEILLSKLNK